MKKLKLLLTAFALLGGVISANAQLWVTAMAANGMLQF